MTPGGVRVLFFLVSAIVAGTAATAETPVRITDLSPAGVSGVPYLDAAVLADKLYFAGTADGGEPDLWVYDGIAPPSMVPGSAGIRPEELTVWAGALYFEGGPSADRELWRYDGVNSPVEALDLMSPGGGEPTNLVAIGPEICFGAFTNPSEGDQLVCWDGATAPDVYELREGGGAGPQAMTLIGSTLYFDAYADGLGSEPFAYQNFFPPELVGDLIAGVGSSSPESFSALGTTIYLRASGAGGQGRVWSADGISAPTQVSLLLDVEGGVTTWHDDLFAVGSLDDPEELVGGIPNLHVLRAGEFEPVASPAWAVLGAGDFLDYENALYFRASGGTNPSSDLFRYCGAGGVERVTDQFDDASYVSSEPVLFQGLLYFSAFEAATGHELWVLDPYTALFCDGFAEGDEAAWSSSFP